MTRTQLNITNESQQISPFPAGKHNSAISRRENMTNTRHKTHMIHKRSAALERSVKYTTEGLKQFHSANLSSLIARQLVGLQSLWWFWLQYLFFDEMVGAWCFGCCQAHRVLLVWCFCCCVQLYVLLSPNLCFSPFYILIYLF